MIVIDLSRKINKIIEMKSIFLKKQSTLPPNYYSNQHCPSNFAMKDLEQAIDPANHLPHRNLCKCSMCIKNEYQTNKTQGINNLQSNTLIAKKLFKKLLQGLIKSGTKTLKLFIPDLFFVQGDSLEIYQTSKDSRVSKLAGATPIKYIYSTMLRMRMQYKSQLQQIFNKKMYDKVDPELMHTKYYDICVPPHFYPGMASPFLQGNKSHFKRYILHKDKRYQIQSLEQHKMNERQPFCIVVYRDGNSQLLNQVQFELFTLQSYNKIQDQVIYFQSYIKYKKQNDSILYSEYNYSPQNIDLQMDSKSQIEIMIILGGMNKYDQGYNDIQTLEQISIELMLNEPKKYVQMMTYKIVHYLAMASRIYVSHIKIKWIINDIGTIYIQQIMECKISEVSGRIIRFKLPKADQNAIFYSDKSNDFLDMYKDLKKRRVLNTLIIKRDVNGRTYEDLLAAMNPQMKQLYDIRQNEENNKINYVFKYSKQKKKTKVQNKLYNTIDLTNQQKKLIVPRRLKVLDVSTYEEHIKQHPELLMKNMRYDSVSLSRYAPEKTEKVDSKINNHFTIHMSSEDKKMISNLNRNNREQKMRSSLDRYIQKRKDRLEKSLLYTTFHDLNRQNVKKMNNLFGHQRIAEKLVQNSTK